MKEYFLGLEAYRNQVKYECKKKHIIFVSEDEVPMEFNPCRDEKTIDMKGSK